MFMRIIFTHPIRYQVNGQLVSRFSFLFKVAIAPLYGKRYVEQGELIDDSKVKTLIGYIQ